MTSQRVIWNITNNTLFKYFVEASFKIIVLKLSESFKLIDAIFKVNHSLQSL